MFIMNQEYLPSTPHYFCSAIINHHIRWYVQSPTYRSLQLVNSYKPHGSPSFNMDGNNHHSPGKQHGEPPSWWVQPAHQSPRLAFLFSFHSAASDAAGGRRLGVLPRAVDRLAL